ncbi:MAG: UDP-N-acetylmuramyl-tripeptide synthetase [bacterium]
MEKFKKYTSVEINSKKCNKNSIFIVLNDKYSNNTHYINDAITHGATLIISNYKINCSVKNVVYKNIYYIFYKLLNFFYPNNIKLIGVTGTDGKTSTCLMIQSLISQNSNCGYIGTNGIIFNNNVREINNTTPDIVTIRKSLFEMYVTGVKYVAMECSSEGILSNRLFSLEFDSIVYTNITHEHLNTHKTMDNYVETKLSLIKRIKNNGLIIVNGDDYYLTKIRGKNVITYGLYNADCVAHNIKQSINETKFDYKYKTNNVVTIPFFGKYNIYNFLASILVLEQFNLNYNLDFNLMNKINGRFELIKSANKEVVIDFAHTPNALENLLKNIRQVTRKNIILVMGSSGGKDASKRPLLGYIADKYASDIIITSEDPKNELITNIFYDLTTKIKKEYYLVLFRKDAIKMGLELCDENSILVIVGKGVENTEQIYNIKFPHNDYLYTKSLLNA